MSRDDARRPGHQYQRPDCEERAVDPSAPVALCEDQPKDCLHVVPSCSHRVLSDIGDILYTIRGCSGSQRIVDQHRIGPRVIRLLTILLRPDIIQ